MVQLARFELATSALWRQNSLLPVRKQEQIKMVRYPRNHLDLLCQPGRRQTAGLLTCAGFAEFEDAGQLALDRNAQ